MDSVSEAVKRKADKSDSDEEWVGPKIEESWVPKKKKSKHSFFFPTEF